MEYIFKLKISISNGEIKNVRIRIVEEKYWKAFEKMEDILIRKYGNYKFLQCVIEEGKKE